MSHPKVSEALVHILAQIGVKQIFGVVGDALNSITDAIRRNGKIQWIGVRHEETAAFAAGAQAQLTGELGVCAGTVGPGAIHLLNGLYDTKHSHAPVLAITGQVPVEEMGTDYHQEVDLQKLFDDVSVFNHTVVSPRQMPRAAHLAIQTALTQRGVAHLCFPGDICHAELPTNEISQDFYRHSCESAPAPDELRKAAELLNDAKRVTILGGIGTRGARKELLELALCLQAPIVYALRGKEVLEFDNPYAVGMTGLIGTPAGADALEDADVLLLVGTDFPYRNWIPGGKKVVQIDRNADRLARRTPIEAGLVGDARCALQALLPLVKSGKDSSHLQSAQKHRDHWKEKELKKIRSDQGKKPIRPEWLARTISDLADDDAIFCADTGCVWCGPPVIWRCGKGDASWVLLITAPWPTPCPRPSGPRPLTPNDR
jgi:pyruvate dehydrogenase (quinone)